MIKESIRNIIFVLVFAANFCVVSSAEYESGIELGDWGIPLIPRAHSYNGLDPNIEFCRLISTPTRSFILSIQPMISSGVGSEEISFKPQWMIFKNVAHHFDKDKFSVSIDADCHLKIMGNSTCQEMNFKGSVCFHDPHHVSPDSMHLGFKKESTSKAIEYDVTYSNGKGSEFAASRNGSHKHGIILLLDNTDMETIKSFGINPSNSNEEIYEILRQIPMINQNLLLRQEFGVF